MTKLAYQNGIAGIKDKHGKYIDTTPEYCDWLNLKYPNQIIGRTDLEILKDAANPEHYNLTQFADELVSEDEQVMRNQQVFIFECQIIHEQPIFAIVHKSPYIENNKTVGALFTAIQFPHLPKAAINNHINNPNMTIAGHTKKYLEILGFTIEKKYNFSKRELECINFLVKGCSAYDISLELGLSKRTIEFYIRNIKDKLDVKKSAEIVAYALNEGVISH